MIAATCLTIKPRAFVARRDRRRRASREEMMLNGVDRLKAEIEPRRWSITIGCHLIGIFHNEPLDQVVAELVRWAADSAHLASLGWPRCCVPWPLSPGEQIAVWRHCRLQAIVSIESDGRAFVTRF
jgi:hypothetical protein